MAAVSALIKNDAHVSCSGSRALLSESNYFVDVPSLYLDLISLVKGNCDYFPGVFL